MVEIPTLNTEDIGENIKRTEDIGGHRTHCKQRRLSARLLYQHQLTTSGYDLCKVAHSQVIQSDVKQYWRAGEGPGVCQSLHWL